MATMLLCTWQPCIHNDLSRPSGSRLWSHSIAKVNESNIMATSYYLTSTWGMHLTACTHIHSLILMCTHSHTHIHSRMHTHTHTHTHSHSHTLALMRFREAILNTHRHNTNGILWSNYWYKEVKTYMTNVRVHVHMHVYIKSLVIYYP